MSREHPVFCRVPSHMKGWEAFGVVGPEDQGVTVRRLGEVTFTGKGEATTEERPGTQSWGPDDVKLGVAAIQWCTYADSTSGGYLYVCGTDCDAVARRWFDVAAAMGAALTVCWPKATA